MCVWRQAGVGSGGVQRQHTADPGDPKPPCGHDRGWGRYITFPAYRGWRGWLGYEESWMLHTRPFLDEDYAAACACRSMCYAVPGHMAPRGCHKGPYCHYWPQSGWRGLQCSYPRVGHPPSTSTSETGDIHTHAQQSCTWACPQSMGQHALLDTWAHWP